MQINRAYKYELDLNNKQRSACVKHAGAARWAYNYGLSRKKEAYKTDKTKLSSVDLHKEVVRLKKTTHPWLLDVSKCSPHEALRNLDKAFVNFFKGRSRFPTPKKRKDGIGNFTLLGSIHVNKKSIQLPRIGIVKLKEETNVSGRILSATVSERAGKWFVSILVETSIEVPENQGDSVGVDLGINKLAVLSDGTVFQNPKAYRRMEKLLKRVQKNLSRKKKGSHRREIAKLRVAKIHYRIWCVRQDAIHKLTTHLAKNFSVVGIEDLNVSGILKNHKLAKSISDASFGEIRRQLEYKCKWYGSELVVNDRFFPSSKKCSKCGFVKDSLGLSERVFHCEKCGFTCDRDANASLNLRPAVRRALRTDEIALPDPKLDLATNSDEVRINHKVYHLVDFDRY
jgi:putative transposase